MGKEKIDCAITWKAAAYGAWLERELDYSESKGPSDPFYWKYLLQITPF